MNEETLFFGYRNSREEPLLDDRAKSIAEDQLARKMAPRGAIKCHTVGCIVMLTIGCGRVYCRWCLRKQREAKT